MARDRAPVRQVAPVCASFDDEAAVVAFERAMRVHRASTEPLGIEPHGPWTYAVHGSSGETYVVDVVGDIVSCSCPDYLFGRLGTCKHVEAVRLRGHTFADRSAVTAQSDGGLRLVARGVALDDGSLERATCDVTHAALLAARVLESRRERLARAAQMRGVDYDVLAEPLFPYQRAGVAHLVRQGRAILADDMGLGKTVQTIAACELLRRRGEATRIVIVCPASLKAQWAAEIARYAQTRAQVVEGRAQAGDAPYVILNYELTARELPFVKGLAPDVLVLDEAQRARNFRTKTAATLKRIASRFLFVLTGTPIENRLDDLYGLLQLVDADVLGPLWKFNFDFHVQDARGKVIGIKNLGALRERIAPVVLRRTKDDVLADLPALTEQTRYVPLTPAMAAAEAEHRRRAAQLLALAERRSLNAQEQKRLQGALLAARRACDGIGASGPNPKIEELAALVSDVREAGAKLLVFSEWVDMLKLAEARLRELGIGTLLLHGSVRTRSRPSLLARFRDDPAITVLLSTDAGGVGLNLQAASYVLHLDLPWNPARADQRTGRAHRYGQNRGVSVTYLCSESGIERGIERTLAAKRALRAAVTTASDVDRMHAPTFAAFLREARGIVEERPAPLSPRPKQPSHAPADEAFARQRLRLAQVVLDAGFPGDAVRASYEALAAALRAKLDAPIEEQHAVLVGAVYRTLLPSGQVPATLPGMLARVHDLTLLEEQGLAVDGPLAAAVVEEVRTFLEP
jgi:superfamily II DNA or RNA helicase